MVERLFSNGFMTDPVRRENVRDRHRHPGTLRRTGFRERFGAHPAVSRLRSLGTEYENLDAQRTLVLLES
jgi:hypothetical protein